MPETHEEFIARKKAQFQTELLAQKTRAFKDIGRKGKHHGLREAWTFKVQGSLAEKVFAVERLRLVRESGHIINRVAASDIQYRVGYWIVGKIGTANDKWRWGQFCAISGACEFSA